MANNTKKYYIEIDGIKQSIDAIDVLIGKLDSLDKRLQELGKQTVNINVNTGATSSPNTSSSTPKTSSASSEEEKMQRQILANEEKISAARTESYQKILDQKNELKNVQKEQKAINAETRVQGDEYANTLNGMRQKLSDMKAALANVDLGDTDKMEKMIRETDELNSKIKEVEQSYGVYGRNVGNYANGVAEGLEKATNSANKINITVGGVVRTFDNARQASKTLGGELKMMAINGEQGTKAYQDLHKALATLTSDIQDATKSSVAMDNMLDTMTSMAAIGNIGEGFANLFGIDDSALGETIAKMQSLQSILQGLESLNQQMLSGEGFGGWFAKGNQAIDNFVNKLFGLQNAIENTSNAGQGMKNMAGDIADSAKDAAEGETTLATANAKTATSSKTASTASKTQATANTVLGTSTKATTTATEAQSVANTTLGGSAKATAASLEVQAAANTVVATTSTAAAAAATALSTALKMAGIGVVIAAVNLLIDGLKKLWDWLDLGDKKFDEQQERLKDQREAYARAAASMEEARIAVKNFNGTKEQEKKLVDELNSKYGNSLGTYKSLNEWKNVLATNTQAYIELMVKEAEEQALINQYVQDYIKLEKLRAEAAKGWSLWRVGSNVSAEEVAEQAEIVDKEMDAIKDKAEEIINLEKKNKLGEYAPQASTTSKAQRSIKNSGNHIRTTVKNVEEDIINTQLELMQEGLEKTLAQLRYEREKRIQEAKKSGRKIAEQISLINRLYENKEFEATQSYYKKQLDTLKKFENDRKNVIQSTRQRLIETSTTIAENKKNLPWNADDKQKYFFSQTYTNTNTSAPDEGYISYDENYDNLTKLIPVLIKLKKEVDETRDSFDSLFKKIRESSDNKELFNEYYKEYVEAGYKLQYLESEYDKNAKKLAYILDGFSLPENFMNRYDTRLKYYKDAIGKAEEYYKKLKDIQQEALSGQVQTEKEAENKRHFEAAGDYENNYLGDILKAYKNEVDNGNLLGFNDGQKEKYFEKWKEGWDKWLENLKDKLKQGKIAEKEYLDDTNNELVKSYKEGTITFVQLMEQLEKEDSTHQNAMTTIYKNETEKRKQLEIKSQQDIQSSYATYYGNLANELDTFVSEVKRRVGTQPVLNSFQIVDLHKTKNDLFSLEQSINASIDRINDLKAQSTISFKTGLISPEQFGEITEQLEQLTTQVNDASQEVGQELKDLPSDFIQSIQTYIDAVGQSLQDIMSSYSDLQNNRIEQEQKALENEADMLDKELQKQQDIVEKHKDSINDIEEELKTARGDRREHLIDRINAEIQAQREAAAEEKRIEKEKEANEKKQQKLALKQQKQQQKNQIIQATISGGLAVVNALATKPFLPVGVAMAALAAATTAAQIAMMSKQKFANGGLLQGRSHSQGGIPVGNTGIEVEGNEFITNKKTTMQNLDLLDFINTKKRRLSLNDFVEFYNADGKKRIKENINASTKYANGGTLPSMQIPDISEQLQNIVAVQDTRPIYVAVTDIINKQNDVRRVQALAGLPNT